MEKILLEGFISIKAALNSLHRDVEKIFISNKRRTRKTAFMKKLASSKEISFEFVDSAKIDSLAKGKTHGGFLAFADERKFSTVNDLLNKEYKSCFYIEGIEDPYNLGITIRTLYSAGIDSIIIQSRNLSSVSSIISKSSAGTYEKMEIGMCENQLDTIKAYKEKDYSVYAADQSETSKSLYETSFGELTMVIVGGEKRGITSDVVKLADQSIHIHYGTEQFGYSLQASVASTIISYEMLRQDLEK